MTGATAARGAGAASACASVSRARRSNGSQTSPPISALIVDISLASTFIPIAKSIGLPCFILLTASSAMLSLCASFPSFTSTKITANTTDVPIPDLWIVPKASISQVLHDPNHLFTSQFVENGQILREADGILINTYEAFELEALAALNKGQVVPHLPPVIAVGPLRPLLLKGRSPSPWLDRQPARSVVYVSFGSRTAMSIEQIMELGVGLERSRWRFLWVLKSRKVDREEGEELEELLWDEFLGSVERTG